jgi:hypothetical protein
MKTILLVTWIMCNQSPSSYQIEFDTTEKCAQARNGLLLDYQRIYGPPPHATVADMFAKPAIPGAIIGPPVCVNPTVSAVCAER